MYFIKQQNCLKNTKMGNFYQLNNWVSSIGYWVSGIKRGCHARHSGWP